MHSLSEDRLVLEGLKLPRSVMLSLLIPFQFTLLFACNARACPRNPLPLAFGVLFNGASLATPYHAQCGRKLFPPLRSAEHSRRAPSSRFRTRGSGSGGTHPFSRARTPCCTQGMYLHGQLFRPSHAPSSVAVKVASRARVTGIRTRAIGCGSCSLELDHRGRYTSSVGARQASSSGDHHRCNLKQSDTSSPQLANPESRAIRRAGARRVVT